MCKCDIIHVDFNMCIILCITCVMWYNYAIIIHVDFILYIMSNMCIILCIT